MAGVFNVGFFIVVVGLNLSGKNFDSHANIFIAFCESRWSDRLMVASCYDTFASLNFVV